DHLPRFLDELIEGLRYACEPADSSGERTSTAGKHGLQRLRIGFDLDSVVREYGILQRCIIEVADHDGVVIGVKEHLVLIEAIVGGIADAVTQYSRQRDAELHRQANEHFAFVAHELRNPLSSAQLALGALQRNGRLAPDAMSRVLGRGLDRMRDLIESTLSLAISTEGTEIRRQDVHLFALVSDAVLESEAAAHDKTVVVKVSPDDGLRVEADDRLLRSALTNLIGNAVKFTHRDGVVHVHWSATDDRVIIDVDDGCGGLPAGAAEKMFAPFVQVGQDRSGFGLGLAIARQAVVAHGGNLRVRNHPGEGCTLSIELPRATPPR
ncbi:MAG TPA: HAMP domain-containing sensor histidine kinase, partial [Polyangiaceae bacterium]|nr:HAMP domain-containing sensor histidine kinase [Polyangiaceae bacterium]